MKRRIFFVAVWLVFFYGPAHALSLGDLAKPESAAVDPENGDIFISNINGDPSAKDANGFISKVSRDGVVVVLKFIESVPGTVELHAPKGLVVSGGRLYVADLDGVKVFEAKTGEFVRTIDFAAFNPKFLNDLAMDREGDLFVSDMFGKAIYRIETRSQDRISEWKAGDELGQPNGIFVNPSSQNLLVVTWEEGMLLEIRKDGKVEVLRRDMEKGLDGLTADRKGNLYVSSFLKGEIYRIGEWGRGALGLFQSGLVTPADIQVGPSDAELLVPLMDRNSLQSFKLSD